jgi:hypothetical protein
LVGWLVGSQNKHQTERKKSRRVTDFELKINLKPRQLIFH